MAFLSQTSPNKTFKNHSFLQNILKRGHGWSSLDKLYIQLHMLVQTDSQIRRTCKNRPYFKTVQRMRGQSWSQNILNVILKKIQGSFGSEVHRAPILLPYNLSRSNSSTYRIYKLLPKRFNRTCYFFNLSNWLIIGKWIANI